MTRTKAGVQAAAAAGKVRRKRLALVIAAAVAVGGGALCGTLAAVLDLGLGFAVWIIGLLAGGALAVVGKERTERGGLTAVAFTVAGLVVWKLLVIAGAMPGLVLEQAGEEGKICAAVTAQLRSEGAVRPDVAAVLLDTDEEGTLETPELAEELRAATDRIDRRVSELTPGQRRELKRRIADRIFDEMGFAERAALHVSPWDALWLLLAAGAAWGTARGFEA